MPISKLPKAAIVIPARLQSTRLPRKLLLNETGKALLEHTYQAACQSKLASEVIVAADDPEIANCVEAFGGQVKMTRVDHPSGSSRVAEVAQGLEFDIIVNVQGDEPEIAGEAIDESIRLLAANPSAMVSTLASPIRERKVLDQKSVVKVVFDRKGRALYFSRSPIPCAREWHDDLLASEPPLFYQHVGLYAYRNSFLPKFAELPAAQTEIIESLEQLRILDSGYEIQVGVVENHAAGIDTPEDYQAFVSRVKS